jgi:hypothetical protein
MPDYWIKLYMEILDDPKMATLPDRLWRRVIELFMLAGKQGINKSGNLPDTRQIAWILRMATDDLAHDMDSLASTGIIEPIPNGWRVVNFAKRQAPMSNAEKQKAYRERQHHEQYTDDVTGALPKVTQKQITDNRGQITETEEEKNATVFDLFQRALEIRGVTVQTPADIEGIIGLIKQGATVEDLEHGFAWKIEHNQNKPVVRVGQLTGPTITAMSIRKNGNGARLRKVVDTLYNIDGSTIKKYDDGTEERCPK